MKRKASETPTLADQVRKYERQAEQERYVISLLQQIHAANLPEPDREVRFHPVRKWRFDCAWASLKLAVEVDGGLYKRGRHNRPEGYEKDCEKLNEAAILGWTVLRFSTGQVAKGEAIEPITRAISARKSPQINQSV